MTEEFEFDTECFGYLGEMEHDEAVRYFNHMMEDGVWLDPECALEKKDWSEQDKENMRNKLQLAFERKSPMYGEIAFGIICADRVTGQFLEERDFRGVN